jgi:hypothetical protein
MKEKINEVEINGVVFVPKSQNPTAAKGEYPIYMVRTSSAGVFYGELKSREGKEVVLINARRVWSWSGAASLSQLAQSGTVKPSECKFPQVVTEVILTEAIELIPVTDEALAILNSVPIWKQ